MWSSEYAMEFKEAIILAATSTLDSLVAFRVDLLTACVALKF